MQRGGGLPDNRPRDNYSQQMHGSVVIKNNYQFLINLIAKFLFEKFGGVHILNA